MRIVLQKIINLIHSWFSRQSKFTIVVACLLLVGLLGIMDYATGHELTIFFVYLLPVLIVTWYAGKIWGIVLTILSAFTWTYANELAGHVIRGVATHYWNTGIRLLMFFLVVYLLAGLRSSLQHEQELSRTDFLTGVLNTREFIRSAKLEIQRSLRYHHPLTIVYIDLNNFKRVNDTYGHHTGDQVLREVAQAMQSNLRSSDLVGRLGGDEFAILFVEADGQAASQAIEKIRNVLLQGVGQMQYPISISAGMVSYQTPTDTIEEMLTKADQQMYQEKSKWQAHEPI